MALYSGAKNLDGSAVAMYLEQYSVGGEYIVAPDGNKSYFISDHQGNVRCKFTNDEAQFFDYTPFGKSLDESYNDPNGWISSERDFESKYMNLQARLFDPVIGRFLSVDPLFEMQVGINPYHYCGNDHKNTCYPKRFKPVFMNSLYFTHLSEFHTYAGNNRFALVVWQIEMIFTQYVSLAFC